MAIDLELYKTIEEIVELKVSVIRADKEEFNLLVNEVRKLGKAQTELAFAQKETQKEVGKLDKAIQELAIAQKELAFAQKETQKEVGKLDKAIQELAIAQKSTEKELKTLGVSHKNLKEHVGGLSHTVGFRLEDESFKALPHLLKRDIDLEIIGRLKRDYIEIKKEQYIEVNIFGRGRKNGKEYIIIGGAKSQLKRKDVDEFIKYAERLKDYIKGEQIRLLVTYQTPPTVQKYIKEKGIILYFSYEF